MDRLFFYVSKNIYVINMNGQDISKELQIAADDKNIDTVFLNGE